MFEFTAVLETCDRYDGGEIVVRTYKARNEFAAVTQMLNDMGYEPDDDYSITTLAGAKRWLDDMQGDCSMNLLAAFVGKPARYLKRHSCC